MFCHGPSCLTGPMMRGRAYWSSEDDDNQPTGSPPSGTPADDSRAERPIRADLVERVRREIAEGIYDTPEKWDKALDRLLRRLEEDE